MDIYDESLLKFWKLLNDHSVHYIMVGGFAVNMHGFHRTTNDVDIWLEDEKINRGNFGKVMDFFGYEGVNWEEMHFVPGWNDFYIGPGIRLDIMISMKGLADISFDTAFKTAQMGVIEGLKVPFLQLNQLISNKKAVNRPKDQIDIIELEKIKKLRDELGLDDIS